jgi:hypothetical protein
MRAELVPVMCGLKCVELAGPARVARLERAPNARVIRRHRDGRAVEVQLCSVGDDSARPPRRGNPRRYSHDRDTPENPLHVWTLKRVWR